MNFLTNEKDVAVLHLWLDAIGLTKKKSIIVLYLVGGASNKEIADVLHISEKTVKAHITDIFKKLRIKNRYSVIWTLPFTMKLDMEKVRVDLDPGVHKYMVH